MKALNVLIVLAIWSLVFGMCGGGICNTVNAQYDERTALALVQCLRAECESCPREDEKAAIAWVLRKRAERSGTALIEKIHSYCAVFRKDHDRAREIKASTFDNPKRGSRQWWLEMRVWARLFLIGEIDDPVNMAMQWGGNMDTHYMAGRVLLGSYCDKEYRWCNHFWSDKRWRL